MVTKKATAAAVVEGVFGVLTDPKVIVATAQFLELAKQRAARRSRAAQAQSAFGFLTDPMFLAAAYAVLSRLLPLPVKPMP